MNNTITNNRGGIYIYSDNNTISGNCILKNRGEGIFVKGSQELNITHNHISNNSWSGIYIRETTKISITANVISGNIRGIYSDWSSHNYFTKNFITDNNILGIRFTESNRNIIFRNTIARCERGLSLGSSNFNIIKCNNIMNNRNETILADSFFNWWNRNYWDDWFGIGPKIIFGSTWIGIPLIQFDWFPAREPYDIQSLRCHR